MNNVALYHKIKFSNFNKKVSILFFLFFVINYSSLINANAQDKSKINNGTNSEIYRYIQFGKVFYGDKIPNDSNVKVDAISKKTGIILDTKRFTDEEIIEMKKLKDELEARALAKKIEDLENKELLSKYSSLKDIDERKKYELSKISEVIQKDITTQVTLEEQKSTIDREVKRDPKNQKRLEIEYRILEKDILKVKSNLELNKNIYFERSSMFEKDKEKYIKILEDAKQKK